MAIQYFLRLVDTHATLQTARMIELESPESISQIAATTHPMAYSYPTATSSVSSDTLWSLREQLLQLAGDRGFPHTRNQNELRSFDQEASKLLDSYLDLVPAEAASREVWNFLTVVLLPDLAAWRFPNTTGKLDYDRWLGGDRNTFRKLWWREATLGNSLNRELGEDEAVGIMERPGLSGNPALARAMARAFLSTKSQFPELTRSEVMRVGTVFVRKNTPVINLEFFSESQLDNIVRDMFVEACENLVQKKNSV